MGGAVPPSPNTLYVLWTSALGWSDWSASRPDRFIRREKAPGTHWIGGWVGPRAASAGIRTTDHPARSPARKW